jgi:hypothetical protein
MRFLFDWPGPEAGSAVTLGAGRFSESLTVFHIQGQGPQLLHPQGTSHSRTLLFPNLVFVSLPMQALLFL